MWSLLIGAYEWVSLEKAWIYCVFFLATNGMFSIPDRVNENRVGNR